MSTPSPIQKLLGGLNSTFSDPSSAGLTGFAQGLLQASAPHLLTPVSMGQALGMGSAASQQYQQEALRNAMLRETVPFQGMKVATFANALKTLNDPKATPQAKAQARALAAQLIAPGMGPAMLANSPEVQAAKTAAIQSQTPHNLGPSQRMVTGAGAPVAGAQGALPTGTAQGPGGQIAPLPGALPAIAGASGAQAGGAAAATFPFQSALKRTGIVQGPVTNRVLSLAPAAPQLFNPAFGQAPQPSGQQPQAGVAQPLSGPGVVAPGMNPAQAAMSTGQGKQAVEMNAAYQKQAEDAKETLAQVGELRMSAHDFAPGQFAEARIKGLQWMQSLGLITPKEEQELGSAQEGTKMSIQLQSTLTRSLGSREAAQVFATLGRGVPNLTLSPDGFGKMTAYMEGMARYNAARAQRAQQYFNSGNYTGVNNIRDQYLANSNPAYFIIASAAPQIQREMVAQMGSKARPFLQKWAAATAAGWAPSPTAFASQP